MMDFDKSKKTISEWFVSNSWVPWWLLLILTLMFTGLFIPNMVTIHHSYEVGDVADRDIKAPADFFIEDIQATLANRRHASEEVLTVYDHDVSLLPNTVERIKEAFTVARSVFEEETSQAELQADGSTAATSPDPVPVKVEKKSIEDQFWQIKPAFEKEIGLSIGKEAYRALIKEKFSATISDFMINILSQVLENGVVNNKELLLKDIDRGITLREVDSKNERLERNLKAYYGPDQAKTMVRVIAQPLLKNQNHAIRDFIVGSVQELLLPNITLNKRETEERRKLAAAEIKPVLFQVKAGEMLLREGERVSESQLLKLKGIEG